MYTLSSSILVLLIGGQYFEPPNYSEKLIGCIESNVFFIIFAGHGPNGPCCQTCNEVIWMAMTYFFLSLLILLHGYIRKFLGC